MNIILSYVFTLVIVGLLSCGYFYNKDNYIVPKDKFECSKSELVEHEATCVQYTIKK